MNVLWNIGLIVAGLGGISGFLMLWKIPRAVEGASTLRESPRISIIIPARNEEGRIVPLLQSLQAQNFKPYEVIVVDDDSSDRTAVIARSNGATVIPNPKIDNGWIGKSSACWEGAKAATGEWLLFLDADTRLVREDSLRRIAATFSLAAGEFGILSFQPYHTVRQGYEHLSALFNIIVMAGMNVFSVFDDRVRGAGSFGPCILTRRETYFETGGHAAVKDAVMDDLALGERYRQAGYPVRCFGGRGCIDFRMYPEGLRQLVEGWTKSFGTASKSTHPLIMAMIVLWIAAGFLTTLLLAGALLLAADSFWGSIAVYFAYMLQLFWLARRTGNFRFVYFLFYPVLLLFFCVVHVWSLYLGKVRRSVRWRGRNIKV
ncbi:glycosyltransferase [Paenibacillus agaridevorans]|uniref:glycosyltransferase n=1 Tax=Paenibacillus agaridevorans TaxID=171404 RepID=UPI001FEC2EC6|nr:glycosyltransferase [Paenibacillus agaridevorans]